jgi:hypothetical protein
MSKKYDFKYQVYIDNNNGNGFSKDDVRTVAKKQNLTGGMDGLIVVSVDRESINSNDSIYGIGIEVCSVGLSTLERFCSWCLMADNLLKGPSLPDFARNICEEAVKQFREKEKKVKEAAQNNKLGVL